MNVQATSYTNSVVADDRGELSSLPRSDDIDGSPQSAIEPIILDSFEKQMMLAMAVSLAEALLGSSLWLADVVVKSLLKWVMLALANWQFESNVENLRKVHSLHAICSRCEE